MPFELPPGCTIKNGRYYLVRHNKWHGLTRVSDGEIAFWRAYYRLTQAEPNSMAGVMLAYLDHGTKDLTPGTLAKYEHAIVRFLIPYCGHMAPSQFTSSHVAQYLEGRKDAGAPIAGNRERAALSSACNFAMRRGWMDRNPCHGVKRNKERPSTRYVENTELVPVLDRAPTPLYDLLAAAYLTGLRQTDLRAMRKDQVTAAGILVTESKTGKERLIEWTSTLHKIVSAAMARSPNDHVFTTRRGLPWSVWGLQSAMRRLGAGFRFRDLRPKAASDAAHNVLGHGEAMLRVYQRRHRVKPVK
jgi:integrase